MLPALVLAVSCSSAGPEDGADGATASEARTASDTASAHVSDAGYAAPSSDESRADAVEPPPLRPNSLAAVYRQHAKDGGSSGSAGSRSAASASRIEGQRAMDAVVVVARYSSSDSHESARREQAVEELRTRFESRDLDDREALDLLDTIAPEASINERREAAKKLAELSRTEDWDDRNTLEAAEEINRLITGDRIHVERRIAAAKELARRSKAGDLDTDGALNLMNDIAPGLSINERRQAAANLVRLSKNERWDAETTKQAAEETFKLVTGGDLNIEKRTDAAVDLTGEGFKRFGGDEFDDEDIDISTEMIKSAIKGDLTTDNVSDLLNLK